MTHKGYVSYESYKKHSDNREYFVEGIIWKRTYSYFIIIDMYDLCSSWLRDEFAFEHSLYLNDPHIDYKSIEVIITKITKL